MLAIGVLAARLTLGRGDALWSASLALPLGGGLLTWSVFLWSLAGGRIDERSLLGLTVAWLIGLGVLLRVGERHVVRLLGPPVSPTPAGERRLLLWSGIALGAAILVIALVGIGRSYSAYDDVAGWAIKGYGIVGEGAIEAGAHWGMWGLAYPLNIPLQIGLFLLHGGDEVPISKAIFAIYLLCLVLGCYGFWRRVGVGTTLAVIGGGLIVTHPLFVKHGTEGYANLPFTCYLILGLLWQIEAIRQGSRRAAFLSGVLLGLAAWTRPEGALFLLLVVLAVSAGQILSRGGRMPWLTWVIPIGLFALPWFVFGRQSIEASHLGEAMGGFLEPMLRGQFNVRYLAMIPTTFLRRALYPENWGLFFPAVALLSMLGLATFVRRRPQGMLHAFLLTLALMIPPVAVFYIRSFTRWLDFEEILVRSFDRAFMPAATMMLIVAIWAAAGSKLLCNTAEARIDTPRKVELPAGGEGQAGELAR